MIRNPQSAIIPQNDDLNQQDITEIINDYDAESILLSTDPALTFLDHHPQARSQARGPKGFVWLIRGRLAGTPYPGIVRETMLDLRYLKDAGITELISLTEEIFNPI